MMEEIARRRPVDAVAARVTQAGPKGYESSKRIAQTHSELPLPTIPIPRSIEDLRGRAFGRLTVIGLAEPTSTLQKQQGNHRLWVCRCLCGRYLTRRGKSICNPKNSADACDHCRHVAYLRRRSTFEQVGFNPDHEDRPRSGGER